MTLNLMKEVSAYSEGEFINGAVLLGLIEGFFVGVMDYFVPWFSPHLALVFAICIFAYLQKAKTFGYFVGFLCSIPTYIITYFIVSLLMIWVFI